MHLFEHLSYDFARIFCGQNRTTDDDIRDSVLYSTSWGIGECFILIIVTLYAFSRDIRSDKEELITENLSEHRGVGRRADETIGSGAEGRLRETEDTIGTSPIVDRRYFILLHRGEYRDSEESCIWC